MAAPANEAKPLTRWQRLRAVQQRLEVTLSSRKAVATAVVVAFAALGLAVYVEVEQINLTGCLRDQNEAASKAQAARARIAAQDRVLDDADRRAVEANEEALDAVLLSLASGGSDAERRAAFANLIRVRQATARQRIVNEETRKRHEDERRRNPVPEPPSEFCD